MLISPAFQFLRNKQLCTEDVVDAETIFGPGCYRVLEFHQWCLFEVASNIIIKRCEGQGGFNGNSRDVATPFVPPQSSQTYLWWQSHTFFWKKNTPENFGEKNTIIDNRSHSRSIGIITSHLGLIYLDLWWSLDKPWGRLRRPWNFPAQLQAAPQP